MQINGISGRLTKGLGPSFSENSAIRIKSPPKDVRAQRLGPATLSLENRKLAPSLFKFTSPAFKSRISLLVERRSSYCPCISGSL